MTVQGYGCAKGDGFRRQGQRDHCDRTEARSGNASPVRGGQAIGTQELGDSRAPEGGRAQRGARRSAAASEWDRPQPGLVRTGGAASYDPVGAAVAEVKATPRWPVAQWGTTSRRPGAVRAGNPVE